MPIVQAILDAVSTNTVNNTQLATDAPTPAPVTLIGAPTVIVSVNTVDTAGLRVMYNYLVYQTYNGAGGVTGMSSASGVSAWVATPGMSAQFPNASVSASATSVIAGANVNFTINAVVGYTEATPGIYNVVTE